MAGPVPARLGTFYGTAFYGCAMCTEADEDELTLGLICQIASDIRDGKADPEQARRLLRHFLDCTEKGRPDQKVLPDPLLEFFRHAFAIYLNDPRPGKLENLLGLTRQRGKPINAETAERHHMIAWEVLQRRLEGKPLSEAAENADEKFHINESNVQDIWGNYKRVALNLEAVSRAREPPDKKALWTDEEKKRLKKIYYADAALLARWGALSVEVPAQPSDLPEPRS